MPRLIGAALSAVVVAGLAVTPVLGVGSSDSPPSYAFCPKATQVIGPQVHWHRHTLAPGINLAETTVRKGPRRLRINVIYANLDRSRVAVAPLHHSLTTRRPLTKLARRPHLVAATNGTYFDFAFGAPTVPFIGPQGPLVLSTQHATVAGIGVNGRAEDGDAWLEGRVVSQEGNHPLVAINEVAPPPGLSIYTADWGTTKVPLPTFAISRVIRRRSIEGHAGRRRLVPPHGVLLTASSPGAAEWLSSLPRKSSAIASYRARTNARHRFREAYGVGTKVVASPHHVRSGLYCRRGAIYAARTDIAWSHHGRHLILATLASPKGSENYGVDENQMSQVMVKLGAARSYALDGGGSTELVARLRNHPRLAVRSPLRDGHERRIPLGVGVYTVPKHIAKEIRKREQRQKHNRHHRHHKRHKPKGLLGILLGG